MPILIPTGMKPLSPLMRWNFPKNSFVVSMPMVSKSLLLFSREPFRPTILGRDLIAQAQSGTVCTHLQNRHVQQSTRRNEEYLVNHLSSLKRVTLDVSDKSKTQNQTFEDCSRLCRSNTFLRSCLLTCTFSTLLLYHTG